MTYLFFDIGGTTTRLATSDDLNKLENIVTFPTPVKPESFIKKFADFSKKFPKINKVVGGIRGILEEDKTRLKNDQILSNWQLFPLLDEVSELTKANVYIENDSALAGLGEAIFGAGKSADIIVYHDISTGVGGVKISAKQLEFDNNAIEPGHQVLDIDRTILGEDTVPTLENLISGRAVELRVGVKPQEIPADDVIWEELAGYLAQGLRNSVLYWAPEMIILGGAMMTGNPAIPIDSVRKMTVEALGGVAPCPFITVGELGSNAGLYGAMASVK